MNSCTVYSPVFDGGGYGIESSLKSQKIFELKPRVGGRSLRDQLSFQYNGSDTEADIQVSATHFGGYW
jgi:hypothetical protein